MRTKPILLFLLVGSVLALPAAHAYTDKEALVAKEFLDWHVAWKKLYPYDHVKYAWVVKAQVTKWTFDDAPLRAQKATINQEFASKQDGATIVERYHQLFLHNPSAVTRFAYGYAAWKRFKQTDDWNEPQDALVVLGQDYIPSYEYTRLLLLFPRLNDDQPKVFEPLLQQFHKHNPADLDIESRLTDILTVLPTHAARAQAEQLLQTRTKRFPKDIKAWFALAQLYNQWWGWNTWITTHAKTPQVSAQARQASLRDANAALSAYEHVTALAEPNGIWMRSNRASYENHILNWKKQNHF